MAESSISPINKILINIYYPGKWVLKVNVLETATSHDVKKFIKDHHVELLYNGELLHRSHNFKFYGLKQEDVLVIVPKTQDINTIPQTLENIGKDEDNFRERISSVIDPNISEEAGRIRDIQLYKLENKPSFFCRLLNSYQEENEVPEPKPSQTFIPIRTRYSKPSSAPLPAFWSDISPTRHNLVSFPSEPFTHLKTPEAEVTED